MVDGPLLSNSLFPSYLEAGIVPVNVEIEGYNLYDTAGVMEGTIELYQVTDDGQGNESYTPVTLNNSEVVFASNGYDEDGDIDWQYVTITIPQTALPTELQQGLTEGEYKLKVTSINNIPVTYYDEWLPEFEVTTKPFVIETDPDDAVKGDTVKLYGGNLIGNEYSIDLIDGQENPYMVASIAQASTESPYLQFTVPDYLETGGYQIEVTNNSATPTEVLNEHLWIEVMEDLPSEPSMMHFQGYKNGTPDVPQGGAIGHDATGPQEPFFNSIAYKYLDGRYHWKSEDGIYAGTGVQITGFDSLSDNDVSKYVFDFEGYELGNNEP